MKLYQELATYYDDIYHYKSYEKEARKLKALIHRYKKSPENNLLDVACGTGNHITYLKRTYSVEGLDSSPDMLKIARKKHPEILFHHGDMAGFKLQTRYDIITCLFSAIGHLKTKTRMRRAVRNMAEHLKPGGVMIVEPWITPEKYKKDVIGSHILDKPGLKIVRMNISKVKDRVSASEYH